MRVRVNGWELALGCSSTFLPSASLETTNKRKLSRPQTPAFLHGSNHSCHSMVQKFLIYSWFACHLNLGVFHCGWAVQKWQCTVNVFSLRNPTTNVKLNERKAMSSWIFTKKKQKGLRQHRKRTWTWTRTETWPPGYGREGATVELL